MYKTRYSSSIAALATGTNKSENQDSHGHWGNEHYQCLVVADGLGTFTYPRLAAEKVVGYFLEEIPRLGSDISFTDIVELYRKTKEKLIQFAGDVLKEQGLTDCFGTTAITLFETENRIIIAYTGNGAVWHVRGNLDKFPMFPGLPWTATNYLNPHTIPEKGKEALYRLITDNSDFKESVPTIIELQKDKEFGDIFLICTDGIYSADQLVSGCNNQGSWIKSGEAMLIFFEELSAYLRNNRVYDPENAKAFLRNYLTSILSLLTDDATVGLLITKETLNYYGCINENEIYEKNTGFEV